MSPLRARGQLHAVTANKQPSGDASILRLLGKSALNAELRQLRAAPTILHFSLGRGNEVQASWLRGLRYFRVTAPKLAPHVPLLEVCKDRGTLVALG